MNIQSLPIEGCFSLHPKIFTDERGLFIKPFHSDTFQQLGLTNSYSELFYTISHQNVLRGIHFQIPPFDCDKFVFCIQGEILDGFVDLRKNSSTYQKHFSLILNDKNHTAIYLPKGMAHGFCTKSTSATVVYLTSTVHNLACDTGILWNSCGINWNCENPIVSERDKKFTTLQNFKSPF